MAATQFLLLNQRPASGWDRGRAELVRRETLAEIKTALPDVPWAGIRVGVGIIFSCFQSHTDEILLAALRRVLELSRETDTPVYIQLDGENWWDARLGVPRAKLFTHVGGWKQGELLYQTALNEFSCPGWSFYQHAKDPSRDVGVQSALEKSDAPYWAATEWLFQGGREVNLWRDALEKTLADQRCRLVCIYNWDGIQNNQAALQAIRELIAASVMTETK